MKMHFMHIFKFQKIFFRKMRGIYAHAVFAPTTGNVGPNLVFPFCQPFFWFEPGGGVVRGFEEIRGCFPDEFEM